MTIAEYKKAFQKFGFDFYDIYEKAITDTNVKGAVLKEMKGRLYQYGVDAKGSPFSPGDPPRTIKQKKGKGYRTSHVTLRYDGLFYKSFYIEVFPKKSQIFVRSDKQEKNPGRGSSTVAEWLSKHYGVNVLALSQDEINLADDLAWPKIQKAYNNVGAGKTVNLFE